MELFKTNLTLFGEGEGGESAESPTAQVETNASTPDAQVETPTIEDRQKAYDEFKKANKDLFTKDFQQAFDKRFKNAKENETKIKKYESMTSVLMDKYHVADLDSLQKAMDEDDSLVMELADEQGMTPEQYKAFHKLEKQNKELIAQEEERQRREAFGQDIARWRNEAESLKSIYPNLDLDREYENSTFRAVLNSGASVRDAYQMVHFNELMAAGQAQVEKTVADNIRAKGNRPLENGTKSQSAFKTSKSVKDLSNEDMDELIARAKRGEIISFG